MTKKAGPTMTRAEALAHAQRAEALMHARGDYAHIAVRAQGQHLLIEHREEADAVARLSFLGGGAFGASFRHHTGRWEPMPIAGSLEQVVAGIVDMLGPYLERSTFSPGPSGTGP